MEEAENLQAVLVKKINIEKAGKKCKALLGDINNDGRMEMVMVQADGGIDDRYVPHMVQCLTAFNLDGKVLWQFGKPRNEDGAFGSFGSDYPAQIDDIDGDNLNEVLCVYEKKFYILNGIDGSVKKVFDLPHENAHDCIITADLRGLGRRNDIIIKDRYSRMWALDNEFNLLWEHEGNVGHYPWIGDFNGDKKDEVMAGYDMLDSNGKVLWSCKNLNDHADCICSVKKDGKYYFVIGGSGNSTVMYYNCGREIWRYEGAIETQHIAVGKFREDIAGIQVAGLDRIERGDLDGKVNAKIGKDGIFVLDSNGREIIKEDRKSKGWLTIIERIHNWAGLNKDHILAYRRGGGINPSLYDGKLNKVVTFPKDGYIVHGDLLNNGIESVIVYLNGEAEIYADKPMDLSDFKKQGIKQSKRLSHSTLYPGSDFAL